MRKKFFYLVLFFMILFAPVAVFAENEDSNNDVVEDSQTGVIENVEGCKVLSGNGTNIGDEVVCGTENFYVLENDGTNIKLLAKYNLYVGRNYNYVAFDEPFTSYDEMMTYLSENYLEEYESIYTIDSSGDLYIGAFLYHDIVSDEVSQNEISIGAHGGISGSPEYPEYGVVDLRNGGFSLNYTDSYGDEYFYDFDVDGILAQYIFQYKAFLESKNISVTNINILTVKEIDELIQKMSGKTLPLKQWMDNVSLGPVAQWYVIGSLVEYIPEDYSWLYGTTYWTRTGARSYEASGYTFFVDTLGDLCAAGACAEAVGAGIRPVVTLPVSNLIYDIITRTDGNGTVTASRVTSESGQEIEFTVTPKEGYSLSKVIVTTELGETLEFTNYKFKMPSADVEIYAEFKKIENPTTGLAFPFIVILVSVLCGGLVYISQKENSTVESVN